MIGRHGIDHQYAAPLADASRNYSRLERRHITVERPGEIQRRVALKRHALRLSGVSGVERRIPKVEWSYFRSDWTSLFLKKKDLF